METAIMLEACHHYIEERVFPIFYMKSEEAAVVHGTGFIIDINEKKYLFTAKHVLEENDKIKYEKLVFPIFGPKKEMYSFPNKPYLSKKDTDADIGFVQLNYEKSILDKIYWKTFNMESFYMHNKIYDKQKIIVHGFPITMQELETGNPFINIGVISFTTNIYDGDPSEAPTYDAKIDIFFEYKNEMKINDEIKEIPDLHGISGSAVFCIDHFIEGVWSPEKCLKIIGIEKAIKRGDYIRATKSQSIFYSIERLLKEID